MEIHHTVPALRQRLSWATRVVFVPTMGNLHEGHLDLVRLARKHGDCVVVSIFVNPLQFGPNEDYAQYPRTLDADCAKLEGLADVVFAPSVADLYPVEQTMFVEPPPLATELCGEFRPGHFRGVATVVLKLFNVVQPHAAVFGKKDYQQLAVIRALAEQFNLPIEIVAAETSRAPNHLALSSRNGYLSEAERGEAIRLFRNLATIREALQSGSRDYAALEQAARGDLESHGWRVDYLSLRNAATLAPAAPEERNLVVLGAAWLGKTRLIDNLEIALA
ncbi:MAG: pantoate--beta-alanine ligase [Sulfuricella sp.]|nr:pantoate--beta-alanine ligase [Sulfuricella sp.]